MPPRRRLRRTRRALLALTLALTAATLLSPLYTVGVSGPRWSAAFARGGLRMSWFVQADFRTVERAFFRLGAEPHDYRWTWSCNWGSWARSAWLPAWVPLAPFVLLTAAAWGAAALPARRGRCPSCGYDLRDTPPADGRVTCPECGGASAAPA